MGFFVKPGEWLVDIEVVERVKVVANDEIEAEKEAARLLFERGAMHPTPSKIIEYRIVAGKYPDGTKHEGTEFQFAHRDSLQEIYDKVSGENDMGKSGWVS